MLFNANILLAVLAASPFSVCAASLRAVDPGSSLVNITRSLGNFSITVLATCRPSLTDCDQFCNDDAEQTATINDDCLEDCEDDLCDSSDPRVFEFPPGSDTLIDFSAFRDLSREAKIATYLQSPVAAVGPHEDGVFCDGCRTVGDWPRLAGRPSPKGIIAQLLLTLTCAAGCAAVCSIPSLKR
ncbi:hypothetical protein B0H13DRAFT_1850400 [Mycena leptocephala]|nr:hypothetical protein B0H13DRAFT_1850400 [Mycena leptocephala]